MKRIQFITVVVLLALNLCASVFLITQKTGNADLFDVKRTIEFNEDLEKESTKRARELAEEYVRVKNDVIDRSDYSTHIIGDLSNSHTEILTVYVKFWFYDEDGNLIDTGSTYAVVPPKEKVEFLVYAPDEFDTYEIQSVEAYISY